MFVVGVTGGIGSGKSTVTRLFADLGVLVVDADQSARAVVAPGSTALIAIQSHFGNTVIQADGALNRSALRQIVFDQEIERRWLERLLHPLIRDHIQFELAKALSSYAILESPLLFESKQRQLTQRVLVVDASEQTQIRRAMKRDGSDEAQIRAIIAAQMTREERLQLADDMISNDEDGGDLSPSVNALHQTYLKLAKGEE